MADIGESWPPCLTKLEVTLWPLNRRNRKYGKRWTHGQPPIPQVTANRVKALWDQQYLKLGIHSRRRMRTRILDRGWYPRLLRRRAGQRSAHRSLTIWRRMSFADSSYAQSRCIGQVGRSPRMEYVMRITFRLRKARGLWKTSDLHESSECHHRTPTATLPTKYKVFTIIHIPPIRVPMTSS